jgi:hypothetical protein
MNPITTPMGRASFCLVSSRNKNNQYGVSIELDDQVFLNQLREQFKDFNLKFVKKIDGLEYELFTSTLREPTVRLHQRGQQPVEYKGLVPNFAEGSILSITATPKLMGLHDVVLDLEAVDVYAPQFFKPSRKPRQPKESTNV